MLDAVEVPTSLQSDTHFMWLEITGNCQLNCSHCYAESGPGKGQGAMTTNDWLSVIREAAASGVSMVQVIGGEPTAHPGLEDMIAEADRHSISVEVFSNLYRMPPRLWAAFAEPCISGDELLRGSTART